MVFLFVVFVFVCALEVIFVFFLISLSFLFVWFHLFLSFREKACAEDPKSCLGCFLSVVFFIYLNCRSSFPLITFVCVYSVCVLCFFYLTFVSGFDS